MKLRTLIGTMLLSVFVVAAAAGGLSPARQQLDGFLAAFNSGDREAIIAFGKDHAPPDFIRPAIVDQTLEMSRSSGGYDVLEVNEKDALSLESWVRARATKEVVRLVVAVRAEEPTRIDTIAFTSDTPPARLLQ